MNMDEVAETVYDLVDDLFEADILMLCRNVLKEEEAQGKAGGKAQFGHLSRMALAIIGAMNKESSYIQTFKCCACTRTDASIRCRCYERQRAIA